MALVVVDQDRVGQVVGRVPVDARHAHEFAFDGLAKLALAMECRVVEANAPARFVLHRPGGNDRALPAEPDRVALRLRQDRGKNNGSVRTLRRWRFLPGDEPRNLLDQLLARGAVLAERNLSTFFWSFDLHRLNLMREECPLGELAREIAMRISKQLLAVNMNPIRRGEGNTNAPVRRNLR